MRVLVIGHWCAPRAHPALDALARAIRSVRSVECEQVIFGPGPFVCADRPIVRIPRSATSTVLAGREMRTWLDKGIVPIVEGGHTNCVDGGSGFLSGVTGMPVDTYEQMEAALAAARADTRIREVRALASTRRTLLGFTSVLSTNSDGTARLDQDYGLSARLTRLFATHSPSADISRLEGSGAGGGAAGMLALCGGHIALTGAALSSIIDLEARMARADLVVILEPYAHDPLLGETLVDTLTESAAAHALPVVLVCVSSTLSAPEKAQWGIHGVIETVPGALMPTRIADSEHDDLEALENAGQRVARTWIPSVSRTTI